MQYAFYFDSSRCLQCFACEIACKSAHGLAPGVNAEPGTQGPRWRRVVTIDPLSGGDTPVQYFSMSCMHCGKPACEAVCPTGAIHKREEDGIVVVDPSKCIGCHYCFFACPFGVPQYGDDGTMQKCNLCLERLEEGQQPACVEQCCGGAIHFGTLEELSKLIESETATQLAGSTHPAMLVGR